MGIVLDCVSGISWTLVYALAIYHGFREECHCIPEVCICLNFSWEMLVVTVRVFTHSPLDSGFISQLLWLVLDVGVLFTWFRYSTEKPWINKILLLFCVAIMMAVITVWANFWEEIAFVINLIMSVAFLFHIDKQIFVSFPIAILKCLGTLSATLLNGLLNRNILILTVGGLCLFADFLYIQESINIKVIKERQ